MLACGVRANKYPVLPSGEATENFCFHGLFSAEAKTGLQTAQRIRRQRCPLFDCDADFVIPVEFVRGNSNQSQVKGLVWPQQHSFDTFQAKEFVGIFGESRSQTAP